MTPFQLPSHRQNLTFRRQELFKAAGGIWAIWTEGNVIYISHTLSQRSNLLHYKCTLKGPATENLYWMLFIHDGLYTKLFNRL